MRALSVEQGRYVYLETFGCQMNESDTSRMLGILKDMGFARTETPEKAGLIIINTCSVRDKAEHKLYSLLGRFRELKRDRPGLIIGVAGCVAQQSGAALLKRAPYVDIVFGTHNVHKLKDILAESSNHARRVVATVFRDSIEPDEYACHEVSGGNRACVAIMRGCNNFCSYCIVPYTRGREVSRRSADILREIQALADKGVREVTLVGQNVNSYGADSGADVCFSELLRMAATISGIKRLRFMTSHPKDISGELIDVFRDTPALCRHLHLPVQSGSDRILREMRRGYTRNEYLARVSGIKSLYPDMSVTSDIIVGFPGETGSDFADTMDLIRAARFDNLFAFMYSPRPGTAAAAYPGHLSEEEKAERLRVLFEAQKEISTEKNLSLVGSVQDVMIEGRSRASGRELSGRTTCGRIANFPAADGMSAGDFVKILITGACSNSLRAEVTGTGEDDVRAGFAC